ncbi:MAG: hypothetical protein IJO78_04030 [Erysipelotrichaceae bacterium]|nr:hypothetical protein [Erysipelotrichaceae bacterium]
MNTREKMFFIKTKYSVRLFCLLVILIIVIIISILSHYSVLDFIRSFSSPILNSILICGAVILILLTSVVIYFFIYNGYFVFESINTSISVEINSSGYSDILLRISNYCEKHKYKSNELHLNDLNVDEHFNYFETDSPMHSIKKIGVYYSNKYYAENYRYNRYNPYSWIKTVRDSNDIVTNSKMVYYKETFLNKYESYSCHYVSNPPIPIDKLIIVIIDKEYKYQFDFEIQILEEIHEGNILFVLIYEDSPNIMYIGPDVRLFIDDSYLKCVKELFQILKIDNVDINQFIQFRRNSEYYK